MHMEILFRYRSTIPQWLATLGEMNLTEQQLDRVIYSLWDFQQALSALTFLLEECDYEEITDTVTLRKYKCYENTLIMALSRPFVKTRGENTIGLRAIGVTLNTQEKELIDKAEHFRHKIIAHSTEEEMHFKSTTFGISEFDFTFPHIQFDEGLCFTKIEVRELETFLRRLKHDIYSYLVTVAHDKPELLNKYKKPESMQTHE